MNDPATPRRADLRTELRARRRVFATAGKPEIPVHCALSAHLAAARCVGGYCATATEADVMVLLNWCLKRGIETALPFIPARDAVMRFKRWSVHEPLAAAPFGFQQPLDTADECLPDVLLVPLLGFDNSGNRLGQGAGHYDRYCAAHPDAMLIGIAFSCQQVDSIPSESWDIPMHAVATETSWFSFL